MNMAEDKYAMRSFVLKHQMSTIEELYNMILTFAHGAAGDAFALCQDQQHRSDTSHPLQL